MPLSAELIDRIDRMRSSYGSGRPIPEDEARTVFADTGIVPDADYLEFIGRWGGCFAGIAVHAWDQSPLLGTTTCLELTASAREAYGDLIDGVVFADDGAGNPIWVSPGGPVRLVDHDRAGAVTVLAGSFRALLDENADD